MENKAYQKKDEQTRRINNNSCGGTCKSLKADAQEKTVQTITNSHQVTLQQKKIETLFGNALQREASPEEDEMLQAKVTAQRAVEEEEEPAQQKALQKQSEEEELPAQGKFKDSTAIQTKIGEEEDPAQGKMETVQKQTNNTGMPDEVKQKMESSFNTDFSNVKVHPSSSKAPEVGALAYTQGHDVHFAPGQFSPNTTSGQQLIGHELAHVVQQREGRVQPTTEVAGMPVNDNPSLEKEADNLGEKASK